MWICYGEINTKCDLYLQDCYSEYVCAFLYFWRVNGIASDDKTERQRYPEQCFLLFSVFILWISGRAKVCANLVFPPLNCVSEKYLIKYSFLFAQISYSGCSYRFRT